MKTPEYYDIVVRFSSQEEADEFCHQMHGFSENFIDFAFNQQVDTTSSVSPDTKVYSADSVRVS